MTVVDHFSPPASYRAWTWRGGENPADLVLETRERPLLEPGDVLVHNEVIGLNPVDWKVLNGDLVDWKPGHVPGVDGAGVVVAVGDGVAAEWLGRRVAYHQSLARHGSFAEYAPVRARVLLRAPDALDLSIAAGVPGPAITAWLALDKLPTRPSEDLLLSGAGGAVGLYLVQLAGRQGWQVTAMCNPRHWDRLRDLGVRDCVEGPLADGAAWPSDRRRDYIAVIDSVNGDHAMRIAPALKANGHLVCIQGRVESWPDAPFDRAVSLHEVALAALHKYGSLSDWKRVTQAGEAILRDIADGTLIAEETVERSFLDLPDHLDALRHRSFSGKPIIRV